MVAALIAANRTCIVGCEQQAVYAQVLHCGVAATQLVPQDTCQVDEEHPQNKDSQSPAQPNQPFMYGVIIRCIMPYTGKVVQFAESVAVLQAMAVTKVVLLSQHACSGLGTRHTSMPEDLVGWS